MIDMRQVHGEVVLHNLGCGLPFLGDGRREKRAAVWESLSVGSVGYPIIPFWDLIARDNQSILKST